MSYARDRRRKEVKRLKKSYGKGWKTAYLAKARQIRIEKIMEKEVV